MADHNHDDIYSKIDHQHITEDGVPIYVSREELGSHIANQNPNSVHLTPKEKEEALQLATHVNDYKPGGVSEGQAIKFGKVAIGEGLTVTNGVVGLDGEVSAVTEDEFIIDKNSVNQTIFSVKSELGYMRTTLEVFINGDKISKSAIKEMENRRTFIIDAGLLAIGDLMIVKYFTYSPIKFVDHAPQHAPMGSDAIQFATSENGGGLMSSTDKIKLEQAGTTAHSHHNKSILDATEESFTTEQKNKLANISDSANKTQGSSTNGNILVDDQEVQVYRHPGYGTNPHNTNKGDVGLGNVDNTSDMDKPVSNAQATELGKKLDKTETSKTATANKILYLDGNGKLPAGVTGNAATATKLETARSINGVAFDGTQNITITANPNAHTHKSNEITLMDGYSKPSQTSNILPTDTLNAAIGKLEKKFEDKSDNHTHPYRPDNWVPGWAEILNKPDVETKAGAQEKVDVLKAYTDAELLSTLTASKTYTDGEILKVLGDAGLDTALDTIKEIVDAIGKDPNFSENIKALIETKLNITDAEAQYAIFNEMIALKAPLNSPALTGTPTINGENVATTNYVDTGLSGKVNNSHISVIGSSSLGHVKTGGDISINADGTMSFKDIGAHGHPWEKITGKPTSPIIQIDDAVSKRHSHANNSILDLIEQPFKTVDKTKLDGIAPNANNYVLPVASATTLGGVKVGRGLLITGNGELTIGGFQTGEVIPVVTLEEEFVATEGQTEFILQDGLYIPNCGAIEVFIDRDIKIPLSEIDDSHGDKFILTNPCKVGQKVLARYTQINNLASTIHAQSHLTGGQDAIPVATNSSDGLMSKEDKIKIAAIEGEATKVESSTVNGNIKINSVETNVYTHPNTASTRHVTDLQISNWDNKSDLTYVNTELAKKSPIHNHPYTPIEHSENGDIHVTLNDKLSWNGKVEQTELEVVDSKIENHLSNHPQGFSGNYEDLTNKPLFIGTTAPVSPMLNMLWVDIN